MRARSFSAGKSLLLGVEHLEVGGETAPVADARDAQRLAQGHHGALLLGAHDLELLPRDQGVGYLLERDQQGLLVARRRLLRRGLLRAVRVASRTWRIS